MRVKILKVFILLVLFQLNVLAQNKTIHTEVLVVGGTTGGIAAGLQSARSGAQTIIIEQTNWLGGMLTAAGVSCTDGNEQFKSGIWQEFRNALQQHYRRNKLNTGWVSNTCFEPHVGDSIFKAWAAKEKRLSTFFNWYFDKAIVEKNKIIGAVFINKIEQKLTVYANVIVDATDMGDVLASAGCKYDVGTEDSTQSHENIAPGKTNIIQDITWAAVLQDFGRDADKTIPQPINYNPQKYYCSTSDAPCNENPYIYNTKKVLDYGKLPVTNSSNKYMLNWPAHGNDFYLNVIEHKPLERETLYADAKNQTLGFIYFLQTQLGMKNIGLSNEFGTIDKLALVPYIREGRRVRGAVRLNIMHIKNPYQFNLYRTGIAVGDYPVDHHHAQYPGKVPAIPFPAIPSFNIPFGALIPETLNGLIVCDKGISVSNIANGTTRLQPVVLLTGQAAGFLASLCIKQKKQPRNINLQALQSNLLNSNCYIMPYCDIEPSDSYWKAAQMIGAMGFIKGVGKSEGWSNKTFFYPDSVVYTNEFVNNVNEIFDKVILKSKADNQEKLTDNQLYDFIADINKHIGESNKNVNTKNITAIITRKQLAEVLYEAVNFNNIDIKIDGTLELSKK